MQWARTISPIFLGFGGAWHHLRVRALLVALPMALSYYVIGGLMGWGIRRLM